MIKWCTRCLQSGDHFSLLSACSNRSRLSRNQQHFSFYAIPISIIQSVVDYRPTPRWLLSYAYTVSIARFLCGFFLRIVNCSCVRQRMRSVHYVMSTAVKQPKLLLFHAKCFHFSSPW